MGDEQKNGSTLQPGELSAEIRNWILQHGGDLSTPLASAGSAGSGRRYYRIALKEQSAVVMCSPQVDGDFSRFIQISRYLKRCGVAVPELFMIDLSHGEILLEDFGSLQLHALLLDPVRQRDAMIAALKSLSLLQLKTERFQEEGPELLLDRSFDFKALRWETLYFSEHYLAGVLGWSESEIEELKGEFDLLASRVEKQRKVLMHRDFQSQNLMVINHSSETKEKNGEQHQLGLIDYQGARAGSCWYDLASLLWDPYVGLTTEEVRGYWEEWCRLQKSKAGEDDWLCFIEASLQRLMQACGAYGNLGHRQKIPFFQQWINPGALQLRSALRALPNGEYPLLRSAVERIANQLGGGRSRSDH